MKHKRITGILLCIALVTIPASAANTEDTVRQVEQLTRGTCAVMKNGVYISWRLLGTEPIEQTFDIYKNNRLIVSGLDATNYTDSSGKVTDKYCVAPSGAEPADEEATYPLQYASIDIPLDIPEGGTTPDGVEYTYTVQNASVGDVDGDGEYEYIINWDPTNRKDNESRGYTGNVYIDCYELDGTRLWRIDLGKNIRAGSHYTQFIVYDFDSDGRAEMALRTAPGSKDSSGTYVSKRGGAINGVALTWKDSYTGEIFTDESDMRDLDGRIIKGPDWLTMFDGATGKALQTVNFYPQRGDVNTWGDDYGNRSERYLGGVAYLDGEHPSLIMSRGYYERAAMAAYDWDGNSFSIRWTRDDTEKGKTLYGNGNHQLSVCDADNDGKDEIVFGSTVVDDTGKILNSTGHGHGDALHVSDFNNDGEQEIFQVHEEYYAEYGAELRKAENGSILMAKGASGDVGRGLMGNFYDEANDESEFFTSIDSTAYDMSGNAIGNAPGSVNPSFLVWWDGELDREILWKNHLIKYGADSSAEIQKFSGVVYASKEGPLLQADLFGDWREEVCYTTEDYSTLKVYMTTIPTDYKMPTLMHDTQYRCAVAWQNVGYNQPPHPKFFVGKAALAGNNKYLAPEAGFDSVTMSVVEPRDTYKVNIKSVGDITSTIRTYSGLTYFSDLEYAFPKYILSNTTAYEATPNTSGAQYGGSIEAVTENQDIEIQYTKKYENVVYLDDLDIDTGKNAAFRASNCLAANGVQYTSEYKLQPGDTYTVVLRYYNASRGTKFVADGKTLLTANDSGAVTAKNWGDYVISGVTVENESALYTVAGSGGYDPLDIVLIIKENTEPEPVVNIGEAVFEENRVSVPVTVENGSADIKIYTAVHGSDGVLKSVTMQSEILSGYKGFVPEFTADKDDSVTVYVWNNNQKEYCGKLSR